MPTRSLPFGRRICGDFERILKDFLRCLPKFWGVRLYPFAAMPWQVKHGRAGFGTFENSARNRRFTLPILGAPQLQIASSGC